MDSISPFVAWLLVVVTLGIAAVFGRQQMRTLRWLRTNEDLSEEDRSYFRKQAIRRLFGCGLLVAIGLMIAGYYVSGLDDWVTMMGKRADAKAGERVAEEGVPPKEDPELQRTKHFFAIYLIVVLLLLLALVIVAGMDYWAIRQYGVRHLKQIQSDRKAMLEQELAELRKARGYRNGRG